MKVTVIGPVEVVDEPVSVLHHPCFGLLVTCGRVAVVVGTAGECWDVVAEAKRLVVAVQELSTPVCTGITCDGWDGGCQSFLKNFYDLVSAGRVDGCVSSVP